MVAVVFQFIKGFFQLLFFSSDFFNHGLKGTGKDSDLAGAIGINLLIQIAGLGNSPAHFGQAGKRPYDGIIKNHERYAAE